jgi:lipopolysaccharide export LptBFGC system permease protein LptF
MAVVRALVLVLLVVAAICFALYAGTGNPRFKKVGVAVFKWTVVAALGFFLVLAGDRLLG